MCIFNNNSILSHYDICNFIYKSVFINLSKRIIA